MTQHQPLSPLRRRMIEDMTVRNLSQSTQQSYVYASSIRYSFLGSLVSSAKTRSQTPDLAQRVKRLLQALADLLLSALGVMVGAKDQAEGEGDESEDHR